MSIFGAIRDAIFGAATPSPASTTASNSPRSGPAQTSTVTHASAPAQPVDVDAILAAAAAKKGQRLNYQTSIVDLMKLLDLDSSLGNRKELAQELGYAGARDGSAEMNIWLHREVMKKLAANGGKVSAELKG
jgi:hypothetical protein